MNVRFRVTVAPVGGEPVAVENFETRQDSEAFYDRMLTDDGGNVLKGLPFQTTVVSYEEFYEGTWVLLNRRIVVVS